MYCVTIIFKIKLCFAKKESTLQVFEERRYSPTYVYRAEGHTAVDIRVKQSWKKFISKFL